MAIFGAFSVSAEGVIGAASGTARESSPPVPVWLRGVWVREWIQEGSAQSNTLDVHYLQTPTFFADVRIPRDRQTFPNAYSFADLSDQQLHTLAQQNGFTGLTTISGAVATWNHEIQFRPPDGTPDQGRLQRIAAGRMQEHGLDGSYTEAWKALTQGSGPFLVIRVEHSGRLIRTLVVVGSQFVYVRNRATDLPTAASFDALFEPTKANRRQIEEYLDCEFSVGRVRGGKVPWAIERSTLPWREGHRLELVDEIAAMKGSSRLVPGSVGDDEWFVPVNTLSPRQIREWFGGS